MGTFLTKMLSVNKTKATDPGMLMKGYERYIIMWIKTVINVDATRQLDSQCACSLGRIPERWIHLLRFENRS